MAKLPALPYGSNNRETVQVNFGGLIHHISCGEGEIYDMNNMVAEDIPVLQARKKRTAVDSFPTRGLLSVYANNGILYALTQNGIATLVREPDGTSFWLLIPLTIDTEAKHKWIQMGKRTILFPEMIVLNTEYAIKYFYYNESDLPTDAEIGDVVIVRTTDDEYDQTEHYELKQFTDNGWTDLGEFISYMIGMSTGLSVTFTDGTLYGVPAEGNTITIIPRYDDYDLKKMWNSFGIKAGDAIRISGAVLKPENNKTAILREVVFYDHNHFMDLHFDEYAFKNAGAAGNYERIALKREVPKMDVLFCCNNRLWGAKGKEIFASALGDPFNWNKFEGISTDSWYLDTLNKEEITGGFADNYPRFLTEERMITVYGTLSSTFQTHTQMIPGVKRGEGYSVTTVGAMALWLSREGVVLFGQDGWQIMRRVFGDWKLSDAMACSDGVRAFLAARVANTGYGEGYDSGTARVIFVYDTQTGTWTKESILCLGHMFCDDGNVYALTDAEELSRIEIIHQLNGAAGEPMETSVGSFVEFGDFCDGSLDHKIAEELKLRLELDAGTTLTASISYDSGATWKTVKTIHAGTNGMAKDTVTMEIKPQRTDHYRITLEAAGGWKLFGMSRTIRYESGKD